MKQYRNEWKYCCSESVMAVLEARLEAVMDSDENSGPNGTYEIHSLYFDDWQDTCANENNAGISRRFKYRIRYYGNDTGYLKFERKEKLNGRCCKIDCALSQHDYEKLTNGELGGWETENPVLRQFYLHSMMRGLLPKAIIDYERRAFVEKISNVRITLDRYISVSEQIEDFLSGDYLRIPIQEKHQHVLEVKFDSILPSYIKRILTTDQLVQTAFSKYYLGRQTLQRRL